MLPRIILAGGSGFIGRALQRHLASHYRIIVLTRSPRPNSSAKEVLWDGENPGPWCDYLGSAEAIINLAGRSVDCRHTAEARSEIIDSRVNSVKVLGEAISTQAKPPGVWIQAGSLAIYGDSGDRICDENAPPGKGFPVETCLLWEQAFAEVNFQAVRKVLLRIGFVLDREGGALAILRRLARFGLGGAAGSGCQCISWLHMADLTSIVDLALAKDDVSGVYNVTSPGPVTNSEFMHQLRSVLGAPWSPPIPSLLVRLGAFLMGTEGDLALTGRRCAQQRLLYHGFVFHYPELREALENLLWERSEENAEDSSQNGEGAHQ